MRKGTERTLKELYDLTERILEPEITPVLKGSCRIQGPVDDLDQGNFQEADSDVKKFIFLKVSTAMRIESGTCTVCSAPCSSCMHHNSESGVSSIVNVDEMPIYKNRICDDFQPAVSEASNLLSTTSSHDSYSENAEIKSDYFDMQHVSSFEIRRCAEVDNVDCPLAMEETLNLQPQAEIRKCAELDTDNCSAASLTGGSSPENKSSSITNHEVLTIRTKSEFSMGTSNFNGSSQDCKESFDNCSEECHLNDLLERDDDVLDAVKGQDQLMPPQTAVVGENYEADVALDDVKVCDICGDAGREDHLAICSKCSDGAEHTYCMREMLDKVPEGEWLCEECKMKETEGRNVNECEPDYGSTLISKQTHKLDFRPTDLDARGSTKGLRSSHISIRRLADPLEAGKASEVSGSSMEIAIPGGKSVLSCQISSKNQGMGKAKMTRMEPTSEDPLAKVSEAPSRSKTYLSSSSFNGLPPIYSPRGKVSRSVSFNNSIVNPKVKTLIENAPPKQKITKEPTNKDLTKDGFFKTSTKTIFKNKNSECSNAELASKNPLLQPSLFEDFRALKVVKDRNRVEKKNFSAKGNSVVGPAGAITRNYPIKVGAKSPQSDGIRNNVSETSVCNLSEGLNPDKLGSNEGKKHISYSWKHIESSNGNYDADNPNGFKVVKEAIQRSISAVDGSYRKVEILSLRSAAQPLESVQKDGRRRDSSIFTGSRLSASGGNGNGNGTIHSQRGNETGSTFQTKHGGSAHRISAERNSRELEKKGSKWREVVNAAMSRSVVLKGEKSDTIDEFPVEGSAQLAVLPVEGSDKANGIRDTLLANSLCGSAVPKLECIWQGSFYVIGTGSHTKTFFGIQAHLSTSASHRVVKLATRVPSDVRLQEVSHISSWPLQLLRTGPQDENIALFFFAKDCESYENSYRKLLDKMHRNDLALRGNIEGTELLIFTSNKLPMNSRRWNMMPYLWGMFRGKRRYHLPVFGDDQKKPLSLPNKDFSLPPIADVVSKPQSLETSSKLKKSSDFMSSKVVPLESTDRVDSTSISSDIANNMRKAMKNSPVQNVLDEVSVVEEKNNGTCEEKSAVTNEIDVESNLIRAQSVPSVSPNCNKGSDCITIDGNNREKETSPSVVVIIDDDQRGNMLESELLGCDSTAYRKRERTRSIERISQFSDETSKSDVEMAPPRDRPSWLPVEDERDQKKTCYISVSSIVDDNVSAQSSLKVQRPVDSLSNETLITERCFFQVDLSPAQNTKCTNIINISSSKDEDGVESSSPDLELALGGKRKSTEPFRFPSLFHSVDGGKHQLQPDSSGDGDDASTSLSLSL